MYAVVGQRPHFGLTGPQDALADRGQVGHPCVEFPRALVRVNRFRRAATVTDGELVCSTVFIDDVDRAPVTEVRYREIEQCLEIGFKTCRR